MSALAQIVRTRVYHDRTSENALGTNQFDLLIRDGAFGIALAVGFEVAEVAYVTLGVTGGPMSF